MNFIILESENRSRFPQPTDKGLGDMLDEVIKEFPDKSEEEDQDDIPKIAIVGKPNVGKSSLINKLLGERACDRIQHCGNYT